MSILKGRSALKCISISYIRVGFTQPLPSYYEVESKAIKTCEEFPQIENRPLSELECNHTVPFSDFHSSPLQSLAVLTQFTSGRVSVIFCYVTSKAASQPAEQTAKVVTQLNNKVTVSQCNGEISSFRLQTCLLLFLASNGIRRNGDQ